MFELDVYRWLIWTMQPVIDVSNREFTTVDSKTDSELKLLSSYVSMLLIDLL